MCVCVCIYILILDEYDVTVKYAVGFTVNILKFSKLMFQNYHNLFIIKKGEVIPLQARCGPEGG